MQQGSITYVEFFTKDLECSREFYENVFGWRFWTKPGWTEYLFFAPPEGIGGIFKRKPKGISEKGPVVHVKVTDIETTLIRAERAGGKTIIPKTLKAKGNVAEGFFALIEDNVGNRIGLST